MHMLQLGSRGVPVYFLQRLLNKAATRGNGRLRKIVEDGVFGSRETEPAVRAFQTQARSPHLKVDGIVGECTWSALGLKVEINHHITLYAQTSKRSCWQAAASMISESHGMPLSIDTSIEHKQYYLTSGLDGRDANTQLALELGWRKLNHSPYLQELINLMHRTPIYVSGELIATGGAHAVVFGGLFSDGEANGTVIKVYNPAPIGVGRIHHFFYDNMVSPISGSPFVPRDYLIPQ